MNKQEFADIIFGDKPEKRAKWFELFKDPVFVPKWNVTLEQTREDAYQMLKKVTDAKIVSVTDFLHDPTNIFTAHEFLGQVNPSTGTKFTVQFNLFGGTVVGLHTERHKYLFPKIDNLSVIGCFCLTELGYGNNAVKMETTSTYDDSKKEFIVHTPTVLSQKYWITNSVCHANYAIVFGQTIVKDKNEGVNAFLVRIRDEKGQVMPGVKIVEMGQKLGLNGVDNGALYFDKVRIPRENMLNKYADVDESGKFHSDTKNIPSRFFKVTERLVSGRLCIASLAMGGTRSCLYIGIKYAMQRMGVGESGLSDTPIFKYQLQQNAILPLLARSIALNISHNRTKQIFANPQGHEHELLMMCCIDKCLVVWNFDKVITTCRERSGGQGYLACNRFGDYLALAHAGMTAEGDNRVLMIKIAKDMMTNIGSKKSALPAMQFCPKNQIPQFHDITSLETLLDLLKFREIYNFNSLVQQIQHKTKTEKKPQFNVLMFEVSDIIQNLSTSYGERQAMQFCIDKLAQISHVPTKQTFELIFRIYGIDSVLRESGFYLSEGVVSAQAVKNAHGSLIKLIKDLAVITPDIIENMNVPVHALHTPIAGDYVKYNEEPYFGEVVNAKL
ncbi:acyl-oxidase [Stylonychia lemnae]|uniref:Acyl-coenzyme A oxidase n=1 Tax=Stylonychia lemnae TaxID=5949 RepID=A0A078BDJ6_STYLE|nr:acyl-oxidase [Stylonychia lemnae]|eukprot:CDW91262.1 acyl-oxidase [Stylonychia lemnae]